MSTFDVGMQTFLKTYSFYFVHLLFLWLILMNLDYIKLKIKRSKLKSQEKVYDRIASRCKIKLFRSLHTMESKDYTLRNRGLIRIAELGVRTGENLKYFPYNSYLIIVDTADNIENLFVPVISMNKNCKIERCIKWNYDNLKAIPDNSIDAVVATQVLCSAKDIATVIAEVYRILVPSGRYYFLEHIWEKDNRRLAKWQYWLSVTKIWPYVFDGCHLNRNVENFINHIGFTNVKSEYVTFNFDRPYYLKYVKTHIIGCAKK